MMRITRIRLINFHNFVDETIDVEQGGHLFLLGDNGSGKTTVLDAVHYVLSGAHVELNAAARLGGRRDEGRSIQGVVLRYDFERGVLSEGGAIAYAAIEAHDSERDVTLSLGVGIEATTLDARVTKWGFLSRRPLSDIPLVADRDGQRFATTREGLRDALGASDVYFRVGDYRAAVAARLFGGPERYADNCRFWSMAKAYREIVTGARDLGALFRRLLPAPDPKVFSEILRSLRHITDMQVALDELTEQRVYVAGLLDLAATVAEQRNAICRYRWLACQRKRDATNDELGRGRERVTQLGEEIERLTRQVAAAEARLAAADDAVRAATSADTEGVAAKLRDATSRSAEIAGDVAEREREESVHVAAAAAAATALQVARTELARATDAARTTLIAAVNGSSTVPGDLPRCRELIAAMADARPSAWRDMQAAAAGEASGLLANARQHVAAASAAAERTRVAEERVAAELAELAERNEEAPHVAGYVAAARALASANIDARAIYELCEPIEGADPARLAWLESIAGDTALAAWVVRSDVRDRAAAIVGECAPGVRVIVDTCDRAALPAWADGLFAAPADDRASAALAALAAAIDQSAAFGPIAEADARGLLRHRGAAFSPDATEPRLFGRAARQRAHDARVTAAKARLAVAQQALREATARHQQAQSRTASLDALSTAVADTNGAALIRADNLVRGAGDTAQLRTGLAAEATERADNVRVRLAECVARVAALRARADEMHLDELQARIAELEHIATDTRSRWRDLQGNHGARSDELAREKHKRDTLEARRAGLDVELGQLTDELRRRISELAGTDDAQVAHYVRVNQGGDRFKSIEAIDARIAECARRQQSATDELQRDGSRGVRNIQYAARFGFSYDPAANRLADRRDQAAAGALADLDRTIAEQSGVITEENRELMETLVMSGLARDLQTQVDHLERMIVGVNRLLAGIRFGRSEYQFSATPRADRRELINVVRRISVLDAESRNEFRVWIEDRMDELRAADETEVPEVLDYRTWFDFRLRLRSEGSNGVELTRSIRALGSGGEQGVPNYLLVLALGALMFDSGGAKLRPLLFDEAFYGIDAGRRDQLLRFATELGIQLLVASPDQDGVTPSVRAATTLFIVKDGHGDVHLAPYHYWHAPAPAQRDMFATDANVAPAARDAECRIGPPAEN